jgi:hypothetical protein
MIFLNQMPISCLLEFSKGYSPRSSTCPAAQQASAASDESAYNRQMIRSVTCVNLAFHFSYDLALKTAAFLRVLGGCWVETLLLLFDG